MDPIRHFYHKTGYDPSQIQTVIIGEKYLACQLKTGEIGVCATLGKVFPLNFTFRKSPDLSSVFDRILLNAWFNAKMNSSRNFNEERDIFDFIPFQRYSRVVMVGYFGPLINKFEQSGIQLDIFDYKEHLPDVLPLQKQEERIKIADCLVLTATSLSNGSFEEITSFCTSQTDIFLLGPSAILDEDLRSLWGVTKIFGMVFPGKHPEILELIQLGHGTPSFSKYGQKVYL